MRRRGALMHLPHDIATLGAPELPHCSWQRAAMHFNAEPEGDLELSIPARRSALCVAFQRRGIRVARHLPNLSGLDAQICHYSTAPFLRVRARDHVKGDGITGAGEAGGVSIRCDQGKNRDADCTTMHNSRIERRVKRSRGERVPISTDTIRLAHHLMGRHLVGAEGRDAPFMNLHAENAHNVPVHNLSMIGLRALSDEGEPCPPFMPN